MSVDGSVKNNQSLNKITGRITEVLKVDDTLTKEGQGADAKKTGEELARIEARIDEVIASLGSGE